MRKVILAIGLVCIVAIGVTVWNRDHGERKEPQTPKAAPVEYIFSRRSIADGGLSLANQYTGTIDDPTSLQELQNALLKRGTGLALLEAEVAALPQNAATPGAADLYFRLATLQLYAGQFDAAEKSVEKCLEFGKSEGMEAAEIAELTLFRGIIALRKGEAENCINCIGPSSCIFPISGAAIHTEPAGSRQAIEFFTEYLKTSPGDLRVWWILNLAYMTVGEYPDKVPQQYRVPLDSFSSKVDVGRFQNVAPLVGLISRGPNQAGGSVFDDFTGDGLPDLFTTSLDADRGASLFVNLGNGKFEDRSEAAGLGDQIYALNVTRADFDNDGNLDVLLLRGGWESAMRMSLLRNKGNGVFEDVTLASGLGEPITTESAAWGDYDNDGLVDVFVCGEFVRPFTTGPSPTSEPRNRCRLYHNEGNGKFVNVAAAAGVTVSQCAKGCAWGDYDGDGRLDLLVSNMNFNGGSRLFHNEGNGKFRDVAHELGVRGPDLGFACWFWDYNNDGQLDFYVNDYSASLAELTAFALKIPVDHVSVPRLYRNLGTLGFKDITRDVGLDRMMLPMGCNFGDIDNDGFLDLYQGTGRMALEFLIPNLMFHNDAGQRFDDITMSSGTGHLQKGHGVSFADFDCDGDLDLFVECGGAVPGDRSYNVLFQNPGHGRHWLKVRLVGVKTNRAAIGAKIEAVVTGTDGSRRSIHRTIGNNSSFGGNSLVESIGLADATNVSELIITWPTSGTTQTFRNISADQAIEVTEGAEEFAPLPQPWHGPAVQPPEKN
jgi:tetratricopeptide (TPR) repeat protein